MGFPAQIVVPAAHELRTTRRRQVNFRAFVRETRAQVVPVEITNLSTDGCLFRSDDAFETATIVWLKIDGLGAREARIVWRGEDGYGCEFVAPMQAQVLEDLCNGKAQHLRAMWRAGAEGFARGR